MRIVIDTSVAVKWFLTEADHEDAVALLATDAILLTTDLLFAEFASAMQKKVRLGEIGQAQAAESCAALPRLFASITPTLLLFERALEIGLALSHPVPDCVFLAAAERSGVRVVSADRKLVERAQVRGFGHLVLGLPEATDAIRDVGSAPTISDDAMRDTLRLNARLGATFDDLRRRHTREDSTFVPADIYDPAFRSPAYARLWRTIEALPPDQLRDVIALSWLGRGYEGDDWAGLRARAQAAVGYSPDKISYVLSVLPDLPAGIARATASVTHPDTSDRGA